MEWRSGNLIKRCLHRQTQETTEANKNGVIWRQCTKDKTEDRSTSEIWLASAVIYVIMRGIYESF